jgi:hypothetical protein
MFTGTCASSCGPDRAAVEFQLKTAYAKAARGVKESEHLIDPSGVRGCDRLTLAAA